jgi:uncharacterized protein YqhQ
VVDRWTLPPHHRPAPPLAWLLSRTRPVQLALLFAYWLFLAATGVMAGLGVVVSLVIGSISLAVVVGSYLAMLEARRREWEDEPRETLWRVVAVACGGVSVFGAALVIVLPTIVVLVLAFWTLASVPLWLFRR